MDKKLPSRGFSSFKKTLKKPGNFLVEHPTRKFLTLTNEKLYTLRREA